MVVTVLLMCLLGTLAMIQALPVLDFEVSQADENLIFFECLGNDGRASADALFDFFEPMTGTLQSSNTPNDGRRRRFYVTPQLEAIIGCKINGVSSKNVSFAGTYIHT